MSNFSKLSELLMLFNFADLYRIYSEIHMRALIVVDIQNDFCAGGVLPARDTDSLIPELNAFIDQCKLICHMYFTRDWHPINHQSFIQFGGPWPSHCVKDTWGSEFVSSLEIPPGGYVIDKGTSPDSDGYSDFEETCLDRILRKLRVRRIGVCGIATEYCVLANVRDGLKFGFEVSVLTDLIRPIERESGDAAASLSEMKGLGARVVTSDVWRRS